MTERMVTTVKRPVTLPTSGSPWKYRCTPTVACSRRLPQRLLRAWEWVTMTERVVTTARRPVTLHASGSPWKYRCTTPSEGWGVVGHHDRKGGHHGKEAGHLACKWVTMELSVHTNGGVLPPPPTTPSEGL